MPLYSVNNNLVLFSHVPKAAGTSVEMALAPNLIGFLNRKFCGKYFRCSPQHFHVDILKDVLDYGSIDYIFAIVRNPIDRFVSEYKFRRKYSGLDESIDSWAVRVLKDYERNEYVLDNHIRPQFQFVCDRTEVFKFEDGIENALRKVGNVLGENFCNSNSKSEYMKSSGERIVLSREVSEMVRDFYREDFDLFNYCFK